MDPFKTQQTIRNNASELTDYLSDLKSWNSNMNKQEQQSKQTKQNNTNDLPPIRNQIKATAQLKKNEELALKFKSEGNDYFKAKKYNSALASYSKAIESNPLNAVLYSNRALTKLKLDNFKSAESDCTKCIELDSTQIKAYFRRGLARKSLKKYNKALQDFETALKLDPKNKAAKKEKIAMKNKLQSMYKRSKQQIFGKNVSKTTNITKKNDKMRKIIIEECDDSDSDSSIDSKEETKTETEKKSAEKNEDLQMNTIDIEEIFEMDKIPNNFIEFEKMWNRAKIDKNRALMLLGLKSKRLDKIIKNMMDDKLFSEMMQCVYYIGMNKDVKDALMILKQLTKLDRFEMIVMFMDEKDQKLLKEVKQKCVEQNLNVAVFDKFE